jgi:hypothetical protein
MKKSVLITIIFLICISCNKDNQHENDISNNTTVYPKNTYTGVEDLFNKYSCKVKYSKLTIELDIQSTKDWSSFETEINYGSKKDVNFGGKYIIIEWGCGTECQTGAVIDVSTGKIYELPTSEWGREYRKDSLLLVVNPPSKDEAENERPDWAYPAYYLWTENKFVLLHDTRK